jgi:hypothetical protein
MKKTVEFGRYVIVLEHANEVVINFEVFESVGEVYSEKGVKFDPPKKAYTCRGDGFPVDTVYELSEAERSMRGSVKWDGCSNIDFSPDDDVMNHFCGKKQAVNIGALLGFIYDECREMMSGKIHDIEMYEGN